MNNDKVIEMASTHSALIKEYNKVVNQLNDIEQENEKLKIERDKYKFKYNECRKERGQAEE